MILIKSLTRFNFVPASITVHWVGAKKKGRQNRKAKRMLDIMDFCEEQMNREPETAILLYDKGEFGEKGKLIQRLVAEHLGDIDIDYKNKVFRAEYTGEIFYGFKKGEALEIAFYQMIIV